MRRKKNKETLSNIIIALIVVILIAVSVVATSAVAKSDMPLWLKILLLG